MSFGGLGGMSSGWGRPIRPHHHSCETWLRPATTARLARLLLPISRDSDGLVVLTVTSTLGKIGSPVALPRLSELTKDVTIPSEQSACDHLSGAEFDSCGALVFVKAEAREAIRQIEKLKAHQAP